MISSLPVKNFKWWRERLRLRYHQDASQRLALHHAAFLAGCFCFLRDLAAAFFFPPVCSRLFRRTDTRSITLVGFGALRGFSSISLPPASTFSSITSMSASR